jgi:hypothetical protein
VNFRSNSIVHHGRMVANVHNTCIPIDFDQNKKEIHVSSSVEVVIASWTEDHENEVAYRYVAVDSVVVVADWLRW